MPPRPCPLALARLLGLLALPLAAGLGCAGAGPVDGLVEPEPFPEPDFQPDFEPEPEPEPDSGDGDGDGDGLPVLDAGLCTVVAVAGGPFEGRIGVDQEAILTAASYPVATPGAEVQSVAWSLERAPPAGFAVLVGDDDLATFSAPVPGAYSLRVVVTDDEGGAVAVRCHLPVNPTQGFYAVLTWDSADGDLDLRMTKRDELGRFCVSGVDNFNLAEDCGASPLECYYGNCKTSNQSGSAPDWDGDGQGLGPSDPVLLLDDLSGYGPEQIAVEVPLPGDYLVGVDYFSFSGGPITARVALYAYGHLLQSFSSAVDPGSFWEVGVVTLSPSGPPCVADARVPSSIECQAPLDCDADAFCITCSNDLECPTAAACHPDVGQCVPRVDQCQSDADCPAGLGCVPLTGVCAAVECAVDADCYLGEVCDGVLRTCVLGQAICAEDDEPNDVPGDALLIVGGALHDGDLCRGDVDYLAFPVVADRHYQATVTFASRAYGNVIRLLDDGQSVLDQATVSWEQASVAAVSSASGTFYLALEGDSADADQWTYDVVVTQMDPPPPPVTCEDEVGLGHEPNDTFEEALPLPASPVVAFRCSADDVDHWQITPTLGQGVRVTATFADEEGDLALRLFDASGALLALSDGVGAAEEMVQHAGGEAAYVVQVALWSSLASGVDGQPYTLSVELVEPPCQADAEEPDGTPASSTPLRPDPVPGMDHQELVEGHTRCTGDVDVFDLFAFAGETVTVTLVGPPGITAELGARPADLNDPAVPIPGGEGEVVANEGGLVTLSASAVMSATGQVFITVGGDDATGAVEGGYSITLDVTAP